jgi:prevent-host-death family protein
MQTVAAAQLKNVIGEVLNQVQFRRERVTLTRKGQVAAVLIPVEDLRLLEALEDRMDAVEIERILADDSDEWVSLEETGKELGL